MAHGKEVFSIEKWLDEHSDGAALVLAPRNGTHPTGPVRGSAPNITARCCEHGGARLPRLLAIPAMVEIQRSSCSDRSTATNSMPTVLAAGRTQAPQRCTALGGGQRGAVQSISLEEAWRVFRQHRQGRAKQPRRLQKPLPVCDTLSARTTVKRMPRGNLTSRDGVQLEGRWAVAHA